MKRITLLVVLLASAAITFAQTPVCPLFFKRNNGNPGGCTAQITFYFTNCAAAGANFQVDAILTGGINGTPIPGLTFSTGNCSNGKIDVCVMGGNIPPAGSLTVVFSDGTQANSVTCVVPDGGPQPVKLSSFYVNRKGSNVAISWKSETEINSKEYVIQRKTGNEWVDVTTIASANRESGSSYSFTDNNNSKGTSQYRLKMVDFDAAFSNSDIRAVKGNGAAVDFTVFPNPSNGNAKVTISDISEPTDVQLIDNSGRVLKNVSLNNSSSVDLNNLQKGMYMIRLVNKTSGESVTKKLTVVN